jgi:hypothetical protein
LHIATVWFARNLPIDHLLVNTWPLIALPALFYLLQTSLTTSLIVWRIYSQLRLSTNAGMVSVQVPPLLSIVKIIAESAMIYTAGMLVLLVLFALDHPARIVVYSCMIPITGESYMAFFADTHRDLTYGLPCVGIVFMLMALRLHAVREESRYMPASASLMPSWLVDEPKLLSAAEEGQRTRDRHGNLPAV